MTLLLCMGRKTELIVVWPRSTKGCVGSRPRRRLRRRKQRWISGLLLLLLRHLVPRTPREPLHLPLDRLNLLAAAGALGLRDGGLEVVEEGEVVRRVDRVEEFLCGKNGQQV